MIDPNSATTDGTVHWVLSSLIAILGAERAWMYSRSKMGLGRRHSHATFADQPDEYWAKMQQVVTNPLKEVLEKQTEVLDKQVEGNNQVMLRLVALDERTKRR